MLKSDALLPVSCKKKLLRIPIWYPVKLLFVAWLVLPQFKGASFIYEKLVREQLAKYRARHLRTGAAAVVDDQKVHIAKVGKKNSDQTLIMLGDFVNL